MLHALPTSAGSLCVYLKLKWKDIGEVAYVHKKKVNYNTKALMKVTIQNAATTPPPKKFLHLESPLFLCFLLSFHVSFPFKVLICFLLSNKAGIRWSKYCSLKVFGQKPVCCGAFELLVPASTLSLEGDPSSQCLCPIHPCSFVSWERHVDSSGR